MTIKKTGKAIASDWVHVFNDRRQQGEDVPRVPGHGPRRRGFRG
jgi:hypothetical protein